MNACIIFDVSAPNKISEIKESLKLLGYFRAWSMGGITYHLPHNTLWKPDCELIQAKLDLENAIKGLNKKSENISNPITLQRCIVLPVTPWTGIQGSPSSV